MSWNLLVERAEGQEKIERCVPYIMVMLDLHVILIVSHRCLFINISMEKKEGVLDRYNARGDTAAPVVFQDVSESDISEDFGDGANISETIFMITNILK